MGVFIDFEPFASGQFQFGIFLFYGGRDDDCVGGGVDIVGVMTDFYIGSPFAEPVGYGGLFLVGAGHDGVIFYQKPGQAAHPDASCADKVESFASEA